MPPESPHRSAKAEQNSRQAAIQPASGMIVAESAAAGNGKPVPKICCPLPDQCNFLKQPPDPNQPTVGGGNEEKAGKFVRGQTIPETKANP